MKCLPNFKLERKNMKQISDVIHDLYLIYHQSSYQWNIRFVFEGMATKNFRFEDVSTLISIDLLQDKQISSVRCNTDSRLCTIYL